MTEYPTHITPELETALGLMVWNTGKIAAVLRSGGEEITRKAEAEQAYVLHWLIGLCLKHGDKWNEAFLDHLKIIDDKRKADGLEVA
jgi:hypothetical protein